MRSQGFKYKIKQHYQSGSPIPYILSLLAGTFVLLFILKIFSQESYFYISSKLALPAQFMGWLKQPWSLFSYILVYNNLISLLFDCLWLYWIGNFFLDFQPKRKFLFVLFGGVILGAISFLLFSSLPFLGQVAPSSTIKFGLAALMASLILLTPTLEVSLILLGRVQFRIIAYIYFALGIFLPLSNAQYAVSIAYITAVAFGYLYIRALQNGSDWAALFMKKEKKLKVVYGDKKPNTAYDNREVPNQAMIDEVLDKISASGYDSLTSQEREILFRASKDK